MSDPSYREVRLRVVEALIAQPRENRQGPVCWSDVDRLVEMAMSSQKEAEDADLSRRRHNAEDWIRRVIGWIGPEDVTVESVLAGLRALKTDDTDVRMAVMYMTSVAYYLDLIESPDWHRRAREWLQAPEYLQIDNLIKNLANAVAFEESRRALANGDGDVE